MPPLVGFVTRRRAPVYRQHYAGAMALMLRYLGVPARVAGGFTSGRWNRERERWIVSDTDAHAWVEVWFPGYGWLPFDPTPSRGSLDAPYSNASAGFDAGAAVTALGAGGGLGLEALLKLVREHNRPPAAGGVDLPAGASGGSNSAQSGRSAAVGLAFLAGLVLVAAIAAAKWTRRRLRYLTRDPRRVAAACRREVEELAADQGLRVPAAATPVEVAALLRGELGVDGSSLARAITAARFAAPADAGCSRGPCAAGGGGAAARLRSRLSLRARVRGLVSLRSLRPSA